MINYTQVPFVPVLGMICFILHFPLNLTLRGGEDNNSKDPMGTLFLYIATPDLMCTDISRTLP